ncbi:hypothetical protein CAEBREN_19560 [Caenorhabditis brenneri]|uniref:Uncharacterized protein n=1 Tax=Caenorhabditis brenneri TaxID=135651 RepID=G0N087_CAEBE|nr:hypothetical protein CAEBREN_19560 [Caenorhabditis brenneri]
MRFQHQVIPDIEAFKAQFNFLTNDSFIIKSINGQWRLVSHEGTQEYLEKRNGGDFYNLSFIHADQSFQCDHQEMTQAQLIGSQKIFESNATFNEKSEKDGGVSSTWLNLNKLRSETTWQIDDCHKFNDIEERYIDENGNLNIVNSLNSKMGGAHDSVECIRVYEKVPPGLFLKSIKDEIVGSWRQIAMDGFKEFCQNVEMSDPEAWAPETQLSFSRIKIFNEIQIKHVDVNGNLLKFESAEINEKAKYTGTFFFENSLVTVDQETRTVFNVKDDKLFVTCRKNDHYFVAVYERC